jgi:hypothetical protein
MKVKIPEYASFAVEGQQFKPDDDGVYDIPDALVPKITASGVKFSAAEDKSAKKDEPAHDDKHGPAAPAPHGNDKSHSGGAHR